MTLRPNIAYVRVGALALVIAPWAGGCGKTQQATAAGGDGSVTLGDAAQGGRSFDVVAVIRVDGGNVGLRPTNNFTLVLDAGARQVIAGGNGQGAVVGVTTSDGRIFRSTGPFSVGGDGEVCSGTEGLRYDSFEVTVSEVGLTGSATGVATISCGDCSFQVPFAATLTGTPDVTPPVLRGAGVRPATPFDPFGLVASEPMPAGATARLIADDGTGVDLVPTIVGGDIPLVVGFSKPGIVLRAGHGYAVAFDGLVDFAGQTDDTGAPLRLGSFAAADPVAEDGFESATGAVLGGAMVMAAAGALPAIAGTTSLYIGSPGAPALDTSTSRSLTVRLPRQAGDTKLRFSYRVIGQQNPPWFAGSVMVGSEGASPGTPVYSFGDSSTPAEPLTIAGNTVYARPVATVEATLPDDATDEVLVIVAPTDFICAGLRQNAGLLIDDLRLE